MLTFSGFANTLPIHMAYPGFLEHVEYIMALNYLRIKIMRDWHLKLFKDRKKNVFFVFVFILFLFFVFVFVFTSVYEDNTETLF